MYLRTTIAASVLLTLASVTQAEQPKLQTIAALDVAPGNITVTPSGRIILSLHQHYSPRLRVAELLPDGKLIPFPNAEWNNPHHDGITFDAVLGIQSDPRGMVWMLDNGLRGDSTPKLVAWDTRTDRLHRVIHLPAPVTRPGSFVNDLAVDLRHESIYIADPAGPKSALIVVDLATGHARRTLEGHPSVIPSDIDLVIDGEAVEIRRDDGTTFRPHVGINPIALDATGNWLYFGPMHARSMYRVPTSALRDEKLPIAVLAQRVEHYANKPLSDGSSMDAAGNVYISDIANDAVGVIATGGNYRILLSDDERLSWPDAFSFGPDQQLYFVTNQLHRGPVLNAGTDASKPPYYVLRFKPLAPGVVGR